MTLIEALSLASLFVSISVVMFLLVRDYSKKSIEVKEEYRKARNLIKDVLIEVNKRIQEVRKETAQTRIEITETASKLREIETEVFSLRDYIREGGPAVEAQVERRIQQVEEQMKRIAIEKYERAPTPPVISRRYEVRLNDTQKNIVRSLEPGPKNYKDIQVVTGLSREHVSRELKKLYELGFVNRDTSTRPFVYTLIKETQEED
ncbi:MAG: ArsR family transcriptional regulator [Nitrososphaeria archaeon]|nr:ArsR family transcriptional regulator [Nitrososphaeria archaeon]